MEINMLNININIKIKGNRDIIPEGIRKNIFRHPNLTFTNGALSIEYAFIFF